MIKNTVCMLISWFLWLKNQIALRKTWFSCPEIRFGGYQNRLKRSEGCKMLPVGSFMVLRGSKMKMEEGQTAPAAS